MHIPPDIAEQHARMVEVSLRAGQIDRAHAAVDRAFEIARQRAGLTVNRDTYLAGHLPERIVNFLDRSMCVQTVGDLLELTPTMLLEGFGCGFETLHKIEEFLHKNGFRLPNYVKPANNVTAPDIIRRKK